MDRVKKGYRASLWTVGIWGLIITAIFVFVPKPIARIFFHEATAIEIAVDYLIIVGLSEAYVRRAYDGRGIVRTWKDTSVQCDFNYIYRSENSIGNFPLQNNTRT